MSQNLDFYKIKCIKTVLLPRPHLHGTEWLVNGTLKAPLELSLWFRPLSSQRCLINYEYGVSEYMVNPLAKIVFMAFGGKEKDVSSWRGGSVQQGLRKYSFQGGSCKRIGKFLKITFADATIFLEEDLCPSLPGRGTSSKSPRLYKLRFFFCKMEIITPSKLHGIWE